MYDDTRAGAQLNSVGSGPANAVGPTECLGSAGAHLVQTEETLSKLEARLFGARPEEPGKADMTPVHLQSMASDVQRRAARVNELAQFILERL